MEKLMGKTALVVDDDSRNRFALLTYLETTGLKIIVAEDGQEAINILQSGTRPGIILLDMMMPVMDGYEMLGILKKDESLKQVPVIAVTAKAMKGDREKCIGAGAWDYVSKPIDMNILTDKIAKWIL